MAVLMLTLLVLGMLVMVWNYLPLPGGDSNVYLFVGLGYRGRCPCPPAGGPREPLRPAPHRDSRAEGPGRGSAGP